jgi:hypothetical protein
LEGRVAALLPALLLARIDGKSPVEYLTAAGDREAVRSVARELIVHPATTVEGVSTVWKESLVS